MRVVVVVVVVVMPHPPRMAQPAPGEPQPDQPDGRIGHRGHDAFGKPHHPLARQRQHPDPGIDKDDRRHRLPEARQQPDPGQPQQRHPAPKAIAAQQHFAMPRPDRMEEPIGETGRQQQREGPRLAPLQRPQRARDRVLKVALLPRRPIRQRVEATA